MAPAKRMQVGIQFNPLQMHLPRPRRFRFGSDAFDPLSHYWIRYPAKFHPPVARQLVRQFSAEGQTILDPFCGSGSLLVEAMAEGRRAVGVDIDPVAVFASRVKTRTYDVAKLVVCCESLFAQLEAAYRPDPLGYIGRAFDVGDRDSVLRRIRRERLWIPKLPTLFHWFRPYVVLDLARIYAAIMELPFDAAERDFIRLAFAASLRECSNADPVPVSGVEYTAHMKRLDDAGRIVDPYSILHRRLTKSLHSAAQFSGFLGRRASAKIQLGDATKLSEIVRERPDVLITSPPYHNAVDYHRRHLLEMFWLGLVADQTEREALKTHYIGRRHVMRSARVVEATDPLPEYINEWHARMMAVSPGRAAELKHYALSMTGVFLESARVLATGNRAIFVVGASTWNGYTIPTTRVFQAVAGDAFDLEEHFTYPLANRYMSYARHNDADIASEHVLVFRRTQVSVARSR